GCLNPDFLPAVPQTLLPVEQVAGMVFRARGIEGVTYSGGEPTAQAEGLVHLSRLVRERGLTVVCYSGYTLGELRALPDPWVARLLGCLDLLIDGRYDATRRANLPWRGSSNQQLHFLTDRYRHLADRLAGTAGSAVEFVVGNEGFVSTGVFSPALLRRPGALLRGGRPWPAVRTAWGRARR